jgi:hypothetical protein
MSTEINIKKKITALDESVILTKDLSTINFVGAGVVASSIGEDVTVTIPGGSSSGVASVTGLDTDNTDPLNPIVNISVDGVTITGSGTPMDPLVSVDAVSGSGALNFVSKWTGIDSLGNSQIRDNGSKIAVNGAIVSVYKFAVYSTTAGENYNIYGNTTVNGAVGIAGVNQGVGASTNYGASGTAQSSTTQNIGVYGQSGGTSIENIGGKFVGTGATSNYSVQLRDGTEGVGKVLTSMTADGKAQWVTPTTGTITSVSGTAGRITSTGGTTPVIDLVSGVASAGTTGSSSLIPVVTIDTYGRVTAITTAANPQGTVTSVTGTSPVVSSGGNTPAVSIPAATTSVNGYLTSTDWTTFNNKGNGTVTSVAALTLGTTGTDLSSTVATGTSTPVITLQVPTASAANRGALSAADWSTFNSKQDAITLTTTGTSGAATLVGATLNIPQYSGASSAWTVTTQVGASYTAVSNDYVLVNAATHTVTLPAAANGIKVGVKMINSTVTNIRVLTPSAGITIDGTNRSVTGMPIFNQYDAYTFVSDGTNWWIIG